jgi:tricorn protease-like protein
VDGQRFLSAQEPKERGSLRGHTNDVCSIAISADSKTLASASKDKTVKLWDLTTGKERATLKGHTSPVLAVAIAADGKTLASASADGTVKLWDLAAGKEQASLKGHASGDLSVAITADAHTLVSGGDSVKLWDLATAKERITLDTGGIRSLAITPDGQALATCGARRTVTLWDVATGRARGLLTGLRGGPLAVAFTADGKTLAVGGTNGMTQLWEVATGKERATLKGHAFHVRSVAFSPDGRTLACGGGEDGSRGGAELKLWDLTTLREWATLKGDFDIIWAVAFTPDGTTLAAAEGFDTTIRLWDVSGLRRAGRLPAVSLTKQELETLWADLADADASRAYQSIGALAAAPGQAVPLLRARLRPVAGADPKQLAQWIADLDSDQFDVREHGARALEELGEAAGPALRKALAGRISAEARKRAEQLLADLEQPAAAPKRLRVLRAIEVLEHLGTAEARQVLQALAGGLPQARLTQEAKASLRRLAGS